jgi:hypothetical protein
MWVKDLVSDWESSQSNVVDLVCLQVGMYMLETLHLLQRQQIHKFERLSRYDCSRPFSRRKEL